MTERVLIVDDNDANRLLLQSLLRAYDLETAIDGETALEMIRQAPPDLLLLDIHLPNMNGYEVCRTLKADPTTRDIPVVFISALDDMDSIVEAFEVGGADYITKPIKVEEVQVRVRNQLTIIQQQRQIEARRRQDQQHYESINQLKNRLIGTATHDLKNPLFMILSYVALMEREEEIKRHPVAAKSLRGIREGVNRMSSLVADMLDMVQLESEADLMLTPITLSAFLEDCVRGFDMLAQEKNVALRLYPARNDLTVQIDPKRMKRVFDNLISNAIKYTPAGGRVEVTFSPGQAETAAISITDTGIGIPDEAVPHLFEAFYRVQHTEHQAIEGTGLGLSIVKAIIEQHGGQITVDSTPGYGSRFTVYLPATQD